MNGKTKALTILSVLLISGCAQNGGVVIPPCQEGDITYYDCPDGSKVQHCICNNGQMQCLTSPENQCAYGEENLYTLCSEDYNTLNDMMFDYIVNYQKADGILLQEFKDFCSDFGGLYDDKGIWCPASIDEYSTFGCWACQDGTCCYADCVTLCPDKTHGDALISAYWKTVNNQREVLFGKSGVLWYNCHECPKCDS